MNHTTWLEDVIRQLTCPYNKKHVWVKEVQIPVIGYSEVQDLLFRAPHIDSKKINDCKMVLNCLYRIENVQPINAFEANDSAMAMKRLRETAIYKQYTSDWEVVIEGINLY